MAPSGTEAYLQRLAELARTKLVDAEVAYINTFAVGYLLLASVPALVLLYVLANASGAGWLGIVAFVSCLALGTIAGQLVGRRTWVRVSANLLDEKVSRARSVLIDHGILRTLIENHPGHMLPALEPLLAPKLSSPGNPAKTSSDNMEQRLRALIENYDTLLARLPRLEALPKPNSWLKIWLVSGGLGMVLLNAVLNLDARDATLGFLWPLLLLGLFVGAIFLVRATAIANLGEKLKRLGLQIALVEEVGSDPTRALLPPSRGTEAVNAEAEPAAH